MGYSIMLFHYILESALDAVEIHIAWQLSTSRAISKSRIQKLGASLHQLLIIPFHPPLCHKHQTAAISSSLPSIHPSLPSTRTCRLFVHSGTWRTAGCRAPPPSARCCTRWPAAEESALLQSTGRSSNQDGDIVTALF